MTIEEVARRMSAAEARVTKGLREVLDAVAEFHEAETMLNALAASQTIAAENHERTDGATFARPIPERLAYPIPEVARKLGLHRRTIEYKIQAGKLDVVDFFGKRLVTAESLRAALKKVPAGC